MVRDWEKLDKSSLLLSSFLLKFASLYFYWDSAHCWCTHVPVHLLKGMIPTKIVANAISLGNGIFTYA
jgi:hypothetical protein